MSAYWRVDINSMITMIPFYKYANISIWVATAVSISLTFIIPSETFPHPALLGLIGYAIISVIVVGIYGRRLLQKCKRCGWERAAHDPKIIPSGKYVTCEQFQ